MKKYTLILLTLLFVGFSYAQNKEEEPLRVGNFREPSWRSNIQGKPTGKRIGKDV